MSATREQIREWKQAGEEVRKAREDCEDHGSRSPEEIKRLREVAAYAAHLCRLLHAVVADCFGHADAALDPLHPGELQRHRHVRPSL